MKPYHSPWGAIQHCKELTTGIFEVDTARHGGIMVTPESEMFLSAEARKCGFHENGYLCFEEDADAQIVLRELLDSRLWNVPEGYCKDPEKYETLINEVIQTFHPDYWKAREQRVQKKSSEKAIKPARPRITR